jgi:hypothetical protein
MRTIKIIFKKIRNKIFGKRWLFLDDIREPPFHLRRVFDVVRSYEEFVEYIECFGIPEVISFDHDLDPEHTMFFYENGGFRNPPDPRYELFKKKTGYDCALWLIQYCDTHGKDMKKILIHSHNPVGQKNIYNVICNYQKKRYCKINCELIRWKHQK